MSASYDICIVGSGLAGTGLAAALAPHPFRSALLEAAPRPPGTGGADERGLALSLASMRVLQGIGAWDGIRTQANPIRHLHISHAGRFGAVRLHAGDYALDAFGYVVRAATLTELLLRQATSGKHLDYHAPARVTGARIGSETIDLELDLQGRRTTCACRLLVAADGSESSLRALLGIPASIRDYGQTAIVASVTTARPLVDLAYERFTRTGPVALLPLHGDAVAVCCVATDEAPRYLALDDREYRSHLDQLIGRRQGGILRVGRRRTYPQLSVQTPMRGSGRTLLLGNAACTVHSNAAQGLNLALRDIAGLVEVLSAGASDPGSPEVLSAFRELRAADRERVSRMTDGLARIFYRDDFQGRVLADAGMLAASHVPMLRRAIVRAGLGLSGRQPRWVQEHHA